MRSLISSTRAATDAATPRARTNRPTRMNEMATIGGPPPPPLAAQHGAELLTPINGGAQRVNVIRPQPDGLQTDGRQDGAADCANKGRGDVWHQVGHHFAEQDAKLALAVGARHGDKR